MEELARVYVHQYDAVVYASDFYDLAVTKDPFRPNDVEFQRQADESIKKTCNELGLPLLELPKGLTIDQKLKWTNERFGLPI
jgi:hypothetical protein